MIVVRRTVGIGAQGKLRRKHPASGSAPNRSSSTARRNAWEKPTFLNTSRIAGVPARWDAEDDNEHDVPAYTTFLAEHRTKTCYRRY